MPQNFKYDKVSPTTIHPQNTPKTIKETPSFKEKGCLR